MAKAFAIDLSKYDSEFFDAALNRIEAAANVIRDDAKRILKGKLKGDWQEHGPYKGGPIWTERTKGAMVETIRVVRSKNPAVKNILVIAGTYKTWWALQMEYGRGQWRGGARSFMRPALKNTESRVTAVLEGGHGEAKI